MYRYSLVLAQLTIVSILLEPHQAVLTRGVSHFLGWQEYIVNATIMGQ